MTPITRNPRAVRFERQDATPEDDFLPVIERVRLEAHNIEDRVRAVLTPPASQISNLRILVVDDIPDAADTLAVVLELIGCSAHACYDARSALRMADWFDAQVCLVDLVMPEMDGIELGACLRVASQGKRRLLIATTALGTDEAKSWTTIAGFDAHLTKPIDVSVLIETVSRLWESANKDSDPQDASA